MGTTLIRRASIILALGLAAILPAAAHANTLNYNEAVSGDLPESTPWVLLPLDVGVNTVQGSAFVSIDSTGFTGDDFDSFRFTVPAGAALTSITFQSTLTSTSPATGLTIDTFLDQGPAPFSLLSEEFLHIYPGAPGGATLSAPLPINAGEYLLFQGQFEGFLNENIAWNYTWTLNVAAVPLPAAAPAGMLLLAGMGAWKKLAKRA